MDNLKELTEYNLDEITKSHAIAINESIEQYLKILYEYGYPMKEITITENLQKERMEIHFMGYLKATFDFKTEVKKTGEKYELVTTVTRNII